jgi:hypothetical protein
MRLVGPLVLLLLTGCYTPIEVKRQDYPLDWAKPAPAASGCPTLGGRYLNQGQGPHHYLASLVLPPTSTPMSQIDIVELDGPRNGALTLRFFAPPVQGRGEPPELGVRSRWRPVPRCRKTRSWRRRCPRVPRICIEPNLAAIPAHGMMSQATRRSLLRGDDIAPRRTRSQGSRRTPASSHLRIYRPLLMLAALGTPGGFGGGS